jgi:hypothetical protein
MLRVDQGPDHLSWSAPEDVKDGTERILLIERRQIQKIE